MEYTFDHNLMLLLNFDGGAFLDGLFWFASGKAEWAPLYVLIAWLLWKRYGWRRMLPALGFIILIVAAADQIANLFKHEFPLQAIFPDFSPRPRPTHTPGIAEQLHTVRGYTGGLYGTVSAHAATVCGIAVFTLRLMRSRIYTVGILLWVALVCYSRIYLGVHFPMDILLGLADGLLVAAIALWGYRKTEPKITP